MTHATCRLTTKNRDHLRNATLGNRVWAVSTYLYMSDLHLSFFFCVLPIYVARSSPGGVAIRYVLPVLSTSRLYTKARNKRHNSDSVGSSVDLLPWRVLKLTHQRAALDRRRDLLTTPSTCRGENF